ncbi:hypothetical protein LTR85_009368 [Meristemomyces frigidus]|nr:hypothetical protein LTR85_009368 [Meristemomyces frigidus]
MAPSKVGYYQGGYSSAASQNVALPAQIKCNRCFKLKGQNAFATNRLGDLKEKIKANGSKFNATTSAYIPCTKCTPQQVVELECGWCDITKGVDSFSNEERRKGDGVAKCRPCIVKMYEQEPGNEDSDESGSSKSRDSSDNESDYENDAHTVSGTFSGMSLSGSNAYPSRTSSATGGVPLNGATGSGTYSSASKPYASSTTASIASSSVGGPVGGYGTSKAGKMPERRGRAPSVAASTSTSKQRFPKVPTAPQKPIAFAQANRGKQQVGNKSAGGAFDPEDDDSLNDVAVEKSDDDSD